MAKASESIVLSIDGRDVKLSSPGKVMFSERGETKLDLVEHYLRVGEALMSVVRGRPTMLQRFPDGAEGPSFFQKRVPKSVPEWLETTIVSTPNGTTSEAMVLADLAHVAWAVNIGCLGFHPWPYRAADDTHADELRLDLDPQPGTDFADVRRAARHLKALLDELNLRGYAKTSGNKGLHVYLHLEPRWDSYDVRRGAVAIARELERRHPEDVTAAWWKEERGERVFLDFNQNAPHKTVFGVWSVRSRPGAQVSTPIEWDELDDVHPDDLTIAAVRQRCEAGRPDPWAAYDGDRQSLDPLLAMWDADRASGLMDAPWPPVYPKQPDEPARVAPSRAKKVVEADD